MPRIVAVRRIEAAQAATGWPDASNTGIPSGTSLTTVPGTITSGSGWSWNGSKVVVTGTNATLTALDINGAVDINATGVTIQNSRIRCTNEPDWGIDMTAGGATIRDCEIGGGAGGSTFLGCIAFLSGQWNASRSLNTILRCNIHHTVHGGRVDGNTLVQDSYIHDIPHGEAGWEAAHTDGIMCTAGTAVTIRHNTFERGTTAPFFVQWQTGNVQISNYLIEDNYFLGVSAFGQQSSYGVMFENKGISSAPIIRNNTFAGTVQAGHILCPAGSTTTGNVVSPGGGAATVEID